MISDINTFINNFRDVLNNSWSSLVKIAEGDTTGSFIPDWLQSNWELIVESKLLNSEKQSALEVYGDGADANGDSSRILYPNLLPTNKITCIAKSMNLIDELTGNILKVKNIDFDRFVTIKDGWYLEATPFDKVLGFLDGKEVVINLSDIIFKLEAV